MAYITTVSTIDFPHKASQQVIKQLVAGMFAEGYAQTATAIQLFDNAQIEWRNFSQPLDYYLRPRSFQEQNRQYIDTALQYSADAVLECLSHAGVSPQEVTDILFVSSTGLATPSLDALLINKLRLNPTINRLPVWGLGCGGGVSALAKAHQLAQTNPHAEILVVAVELCSLCFMRQDFTKSNLVATGLFSDGVACALVSAQPHSSAPHVSVSSAESRMAYDTLDIMGWDFLDNGFKVIFSRDIPAYIINNVSQDISGFLSQQSLTLSDITHFIFHPGGRKVIEAYNAALDLPPEALTRTREVMRDYGNMSSPTVLYVLSRFMQNPSPGTGLMLALGPGFSTEMLLLEME